MIKLYGMPLSNFYNAIKLTLLEKGFEFEEVLIYPSQEPEFLAMSPMGKVPFIEVQEVFLSATQAILEFLEDINPDISLFPDDAYERAKARELIKMFELYIDAPTRRLIPMALRGTELSENTIRQTRESLERGFKAIEMLAVLDPHMAGENFSYADIYAYYALSLARKVCKKVYQWDILTEVVGLNNWFDNMALRTFVKEVDVDSVAAMSQFFDTE